MPCSACGGKVRSSYGGRRIGMSLGIRGCSSYYKYRPRPAPAPAPAPAPPSSGGS